MSARHDLLRLLAVLLGLATASAPAAGADYPPVTVSMTAQQVAPDVYVVQGRAGGATEHEGFISNAGFVVTSAGVVVLDALGSPSLATRMRELIRAVTDKPVVKVVVTHYHADHIYGLQVYKDEGAQIVAPAGATAYLRGPQAVERLAERRQTLAPFVNDATRLVPPDTLVDADTTFTVGSHSFRLQPFGAVHSDGDLTMRVQPGAVLFSGDLLFEGRVPFVGDADSRRWLDALDSLLATELAVLVPGHGAPSRDPRSTLALTRDYLAYLRGAMGRAVEEMVPFEEAYAAVDWSRYQGLPAFESANRRNAYAVYLGMENEAMGRP
jgi:glyoxylase-like metal-dependent hydrolase (beta-lactamase superfamily II)